MSETRSRFLPALGVTLALLALPATSARADRPSLTVRSGDVLGTIAQRHRVSVAQLRDWNGLESDRIYEGQRLYVGPGEAEAAPETYVVAEGDTLSEIAQRLRVDLQQLTEWNGGLDPDRIQAGQRLRIGPALRRVVHRVRAGDTLSAVARLYGATVSDLRRWNPRARRSLIRIGERLLVYSARPLSLSESIGAPHRGQLERGVRLAPHRAFVIRDRDAAWGTRETVDYLVQGFQHVLSAHPGAPRVRVHDLSLREGGPMTGHRSHQSGRDVDIAYYQRRCPEPACRIGRIGPAQIAVGPQWTLLSHWLRAGLVEAIFIDYELQQPLYAEARRRGASPAELSRWFQYPRGRDFPLGLIRHFPHHRDHIHVRFVCHRTDEECR